ncbi:hypothetical protein NPX13_g9134 [Xylaria arbuscula]|uniref:Uncharacterized protein n=1 Tax=Xylaria arbuscula TaxID=114810 RepID=A0A9W8N751_9PEZI|nr:hypothetical protein NPX13_g9134 [Xylaria arbuscula]
MTDVRIQTIIHNRYLVFDASGQLPFSIVYGLCRRAKEDVDARSIVLRTAESALDVPYAIAKGLLTLKEKDEGSGEMRSVGFGVKKMRVEDGNGSRGEGDEGGEGGRKGEYVILPSPVSRTKNWKEDLTVYQYRIDPRSPLGLLLKPGKTYEIRLAGDDLGVKWWRYIDDDGDADNNNGIDISSSSVSISHDKGTTDQLRQQQLRTAQTLETETEGCFVADVSAGCGDAHASLAKCQRQGQRSRR